MPDLFFTARCRIIPEAILLPSSHEPGYTLRSKIADARVIIELERPLEWPPAAFSAAMYLRLVSIPQEC